MQTDIANNHNDNTERGSNNHCNDRLLRGIAEDASGRRRMNEAAEKAINRASVADVRR